MKFTILTIFPDIINNYIKESILKRGQSAGVIEFEIINFRDFSESKHKTVDDTSYGGGPGMILQVQPIYSALEKLNLVKNGEKINREKTKVIIMDPAGEEFTQTRAVEFSKLENVVFICGRYEGFDARIYDWMDEKISVGKFVLAGGELPSLTITEAIARLIPGVLGNEESLKEETFSGMNGEYPQYTRPEEFLGKKVPNVLLSGDHKKIKKWRKEQSILSTPTPT
jgi:tRNA (guanine37-N1)-methyltransferase